MRHLYLVIPVYNEAATLQSCVERILSAPLPEGWTTRLCFVDDGSTDGTKDFLNSLSDQNHLIVQHEKNQGKGAAIRSGFRAVLTEHQSKCQQSEANTSDVILVQDADLEYSPSDYPILIEPFEHGKVDAVIGTRFGRHYKTQQVNVWMHTLGNRILSEMSNAITGLRLTDIESYYKGMTIDTLKRIEPMLSENRFGIEPQIVAAWRRIRANVCEVPITYDPRSVGEGKKIKWRDGARAIYVILRETLR